MDTWTMAPREDTEKIKELYIGLETIFKSGDNPDEEEKKRLEDIVTDFRSFFTTMNKSIYKKLFKKDILQLTITDEDCEKPCGMKIQIKGDTLLLRAMSYQAEEGSTKKDILNKIKKVIIENCPRMIIEQKKDQKCKGLTPIHVAILKEDTKLLELMARKTDDKSIDRKNVKDINAEGDAFQNTVMMAGTLLGVATLKFNKEIFKLVSGNFQELDCKNKKGDNIVHSLIKYAHVQPDKKKVALDMLNFILKKENNPKEKRDIRKLLMMANEEKLTPLQLAAKRQQHEFFETIMNQEVYHPKESSDRLYSEEVFDITEIETLARTAEGNATDEEDLKTEYHQSVLEYIANHQKNSAFLFARFLPVREVIKIKWRYYRWWVWGWFALHFIFMTCLSVAALYRSKLVESVSGNSEVKFAYLVTEDLFVTAVAVAGVVFGVLYSALEINRLRIKRFQYKISNRWLKRIKHKFTSPYSNFTFRVYFALFYLLLFVDLIVALIAQQTMIPDYHNHCLIFAVIIGWYLFMFFLQCFKPFSFFTVLIQSVILDMLKFAFVMFIFLVGFSIAMFMIMQGATTDDDDFNHFGKTMVKMLTIMLGIGDLGILFQARQPILAIIVFVLFVLFTTILLLNALIAMMSNSCTNLMNNDRGMDAAKMHCRLQKLSVILFLESFLPRRLCKEAGELEQKSKYWVKGNRRVWSSSSLQERTDKNTECSSDPIEKPKRTSKVLPGFNNTNGSRMQLTKQKLLDITDFQRTTCNACEKNEVVQIQSQIITERVT